MIKYGRFSGSMWAEQQYNESISNAAIYNSRLNRDRKLRLPYLDFHTGLAQNHSRLWIHPRFRSPGKMQGQLYSYPAFRWRKKKRCNLFPVACIPKSNDIDMSETDTHKAINTDNVTAKANHDSSTRNSDVLTNEYVAEDPWDDISEPLDAGEVDEQNSDNSDYEELYIKRKKKKAATKKSTPSRSNKSKAQKNHEPRAEIEDQDKKYTCEKRATGSGKKVSKYCDFCLGDETENKKTGMREELVSCADCGRSGHPSCLQFTANMIISVKKYPWQCIECKSCGLCGTSDNDEQLLFCDDCDRGYHMYCLQPPLTEPPEGSWSCHLCVREFHSHLRPTFDTGPSVVQL